MTHGVGSSKVGPCQMCCNCLGLTFREMPATAEGVLVGAKNVVRGVTERKELTAWSRVLGKLTDTHLV